MVEFPVPSLTLLQLQSYLVLSTCISGRIFIISRLQNTYCRQFISKLFSLCIVDLPNRHSVRPFGRRYTYFILDESWREHLSRTLPTEIIFYLLRSIPSKDLIRHAHSAEFMLEIIIKWLQVSVSERNRRTPQTEKPIMICV